LAKRIALRLWNSAVPYRLTASALITYSPLDSHAGTLSDVDVPGPEMYPPVATVAPTLIAPPVRFTAIVTCL